MKRILLAFICTKFQLYRCKNAHFMAISRKLFFHKKLETNMHRKKYMLARGEQIRRPRLLAACSRMLCFAKLQPNCIARLENWAELPLFANPGPYLERQIPPNKINWGAHKMKLNKINFCLFLRNFRVGSYFHCNELKLARML